jgi:hypothetical protein|tara:strand:- start:436 stop:540 length:105 start_codon:yes stop_codon:yes gene_type:complete
MPDIFTLDDLTVEIPSQRENDPTNNNNEEEEDNG